MAELSPSLPSPVLARLKKSGAENGKATTFNTSALQLSRGGAADSKLFVASEEK
jgi:hypothetical protein